MKRILFTTLISFGLVLIILLLIFHKGSNVLNPTGTRTFYASQPVGRNIQFPHLVNNSTLEFFTGSSFANFDLTTYHTHSFTPEYALPHIITVEWGNGELLEAGPLTPGDDLYPRANIAARQGSNSWWIITGAQPVPRQIISDAAGYRVSAVVWSSDNKDLVVAESQTGGKGIKFELVDPNSLRPSKALSLDSALLVGATKAGVLIHKDDKLLLWQGGSSITLPIKAATNREPVLTSDGSAVIYENGNTGPQPEGGTNSRADLYIYDFTLKKSYQLLAASLNTGNYATFQSGLLVLPSTGSASASSENTVNPSVANTARQIIRSGRMYRSYNLKVGAQDIQYAGQLRSVIDLSGGEGTSLALTNTNDDLILLQQNKALHNQASPYDTVFMANESDVLNVNGPVYLTYNVATNTLDIFINNPSASPDTDRRTILNLLATPRHDPNQVHKIWRSNQNTE